MPDGRVPAGQVPSPRPVAAAAYLDKWVASLVGTGRNYLPPPGPIGNPIVVVVFVERIQQQDDSPGGDKASKRSS
jgi:hypothetical protein